MPGSPNAVHTDMQKGLDLALPRQYDLQMRVENIKVLEQKKQISATKQQTVESPDKTKKITVAEEARMAGCPFFGGIKKHEAAKLIAATKDKGTAIKLSARNSGA